MKRVSFISLMLFATLCLHSQTLEMFPRYTVVDVEPQVTGDKSLDELQKEYQDQAPENLYGKVRVDYLVLPSGAIGDCRINYANPQGNEDLMYEARKFVSQLPLFTPGLLNGEKVRVWKYALLYFGNYKDKEETHNSSLGKIFKKKTGTPRNPPASDKEIEQLPTFPGGVYSLVEFLGANIQYPAECEKAKIEGRVLVEFVVENDGSITSLVVKQSVHPLLDQEALRVVGQMPRWFPATTDKGTVRVKYTVPISFKL